MPPKKGQKMALTDFLQDSSLGSWADEMDNLPSAPAIRTDEERSRGRDFGAGGGRDRFDDRESRYPPREELPLPTAPPYTAFVGNLAFDIREEDVERFFGTRLKSVKIIKDRDDKPKGFGYVEFETLQDLKDGLAKTGSQLASRGVRVSVAEPPKGRGGFDDDDKFAGPWRRDGPLPPNNDRGSFRGSSRYDDGPEKDRGERMGFGSRFVPSTDGPARGGPSRDREPPPPTEAESNVDWRATSRSRPPPPPERPGPPSRKPSGFASHEGVHAADTEDAWQKGSKFTPTELERPAHGAGKSSFFGRRDSSNRPGEEEPSDWRAAPRKQPAGSSTNGRQSTERSPTPSVPSTPNMGRRKLELLPRAASQSNATSPIGSPKAPTPTTIHARANPFGDAKPVDATSREKEIEERLAKERENRLRDKPTSNESSPRTYPLDRPSPRVADTTSWREKKPAIPAAVTSRPASAAHSRTTSREGVAAIISPVTTTVKKQPFSFAAIAAEEIPVVEGEDENTAEERSRMVEVEVKVAELAI